MTDVHPRVVEVSVETVEEYIVTPYCLHMGSGGRSPRHRPRPRLMLVGFIASQFLASVSGAYWEMDVRLAAVDIRVALTPDKCHMQVTRSTSPPRGAPRAGPGRDATLRFDRSSASV
jgi:hypothetical protein